MKQFHLKRSTRLLERTLPWLGLTVVMIVVGVLGAVLITQVIRSTADLPRDATFGLVVVLGIASVVLGAMTLFYTLRKRPLQESLPGTMMAWLQSHVYLGLLSLVVALIHFTIPVSLTGITTGKLTLFFLFLLVGSGIAWRIVYYAVPKQASRDVNNLSLADTQSKAQTVRVEINKVLAGKSAEFREAADTRLSGKRLAGDPDLTPPERNDWEQFKKLAARQDRYTKREKRQRLYGTILQGWKLLHLPLVAIVGALTLVHAFDVLNVPNAVAGGAVRGLPTSQDCASCHREIVEEWRTAMHAQAQTNPTVVSQTNLALSKYPGFGRACNNCHAPIGTALTQIETLPIELSALGLQPNAAVVHEGVTCIVCHTVAEAPEERRGMLDNFPYTQSKANTFADMMGPPLSDPGPVPSTRHNSHTGFMTDSVAASNLCAACHNVKVDIDGDGEITAFPGTEGSFADSDGDAQLDENELDFDENGRLQDLVLQTTFDEWEDYVVAARARGEAPVGCIDCHMPTKPNGPLVNEGISIYGQAPDRHRASHTFVGVDYNLTPGFYDQAGMPEGGLEAVLEEREIFMQTAASLDVTTTSLGGNRLSAVVTVTSNLLGHNLPTGFAFARQMWLEVSAQTASGKPICLEPINVGGIKIVAQCASGAVATPQADLLTCDLLALNALGVRVSKANEAIRLNPESIAPLDNCDPWLANFQKVLSDGDPDGNGVFDEVPYQSLLADIVKTRVRISDDQAMDALNLTTLVDGEPHDSADFEYLFDASEANGEPVIVTAALHFRHLPPYLLRAWDGGYPDGLTADDLLANLTIVTMAEAESEPISVP